jgi:hypothetical protein
LPPSTGNWRPWVKRFGKPPQRGNKLRRRCETPVSPALVALHNGLRKCASIWCLLRAPLALHARTRCRGQQTKVFCFFFSKKKTFLRHAWFS